MTQRPEGVSNHQRYSPGPQISLIFLQRFSTFPNWMVFLSQGNDFLESLKGGAPQRIWQGEMVGYDLDPFGIHGAWSWNAELIWVGQAISSSTLFWWYLDIFFWIQHICDTHTHTKFTMCAEASVINHLETVYLVTLGHFWVLSWKVTVLSRPSLPVKSPSRTRWKVHFRIATDVAWVGARTWIRFTPSQPYCLRDFIPMWQELMYPRQECFNARCAWSFLLQHARDMFPSMWMSSAVSCAYKLDCWWGKKDFDAWFWSILNSSI